MKAMILAAGLATRLRPVSERTPKALIRVGGKTMLEIISEKLMAAGVTEIVVNVHHLAGQIKSHIGRLQIPGLSFHISDESGRLLDTGGGLKHARQWLEGDQHFFLYNIDILCDLDLSQMASVHAGSGALATLAVSRRPTTRFFLWEGDMLAGWENTATHEKILCRPAPLHPMKTDEKNGPMQNTQLSRKAFSGIAVLSPAIFDLITETGAFSIKDVYLRLAKAHRIACFEHDHRKWFDIGTPERLAIARQMAGRHSLK